MKSLMSFVFLMPMIFSAAPLRAESERIQTIPDSRDSRCHDDYCPRPIPYPRYCPEGTHRVFDEYTGRTICVKNDDYEPRPLPWYEDRMKELSGKMSGDDMSAKGAALDRLFDAAFFKGDLKLVQPGRRAKPTIRKVNLDEQWGGPTGNPPELPENLKPHRQEPQRQEPQRQEPPRQEPQRQSVPEIPKLPPSVIPGTTRPA